jgi:hypothetical protein
MTQICLQKKKEWEKEPKFVLSSYQLYVNMGYWRTNKKKSSDIDMHSSGMLRIIA